MKPDTPLQLSYFKGAAQPALLEATIGDHLDEIAARFPHQEALVVHHQDIRWSYGEYLCEIEKLARGLLSLGIRPGSNSRAAITSTC
jgi:fatty-acyl-CoA synthase